jgi:predicted lipoprotein
MKYLSFSLLLFSLFGLLGCKDDDGSGNCDSNFDQKAMFVNVADNLILPTYAELQEKVNDMSAKTNAFVSNPTVETLDSLRSSFLGAYFVWQQAAQYEFGPAEEVFLRSSVNNFPADTAAISANIETGSYDFDIPDAYDKGFPALDFLLFGIAPDASVIVAKFSGGQGEKFRQYLSAVVADIKERVDQTLSGWTSGYKETFINNTGTAAGTSLSLIINNLDHNYEMIKREKLGIPSGVLTLGFPNPDKVEAYFSGISLELAIAALEASEQLFLGKSNTGTDGPGLDDYLVEVKAMKSGQLLSDIIKSQFTSAINAVKGLAAPLSGTVQNDKDSVLQAYNEVSKQLVNIKTDMPSVLCVSITYIDNPSDSD